MAKGSTAWFEYEGEVDSEINYREAMFSFEGCTLTKRVGQHQPGEKFDMIELHFGVNGEGEMWAYGGSTSSPFIRSVIHFVLDID